MSKKTENRKNFEKRKKLIYELICTKEYRPMRTKEIAALLEVPKAQRVVLQQVLDELLNEGKIAFNKKGQYKKKKLQREPRGLYKTGTFIGHQKGFGFVELEEEDADDLFIPADQVHGALHMDQVQVKVNPKKDGKRLEGSITKILGHGIREVVGTFQRSRNFGFVVVDNSKFTKDLFVPKELSMNAESGDKVVAVITNYGTEKQNPQGKIREVLGGENDPGTDILAIARSSGLPMDFPEKVLEQAERVGQGVMESDFQGRMDLRDLDMVTIDGEDAKDLDDAVSLTVENDLYHLGVHIADVANYVQDHSALDREALKRGTSVYLVDRVIPMLPKVLSNGICSLNAGEERLALSCLMTVDKNGNVVDAEVTESVINVNRRMSYNQVQKILVEEDAALIEEHKELVPMFRAMHALSHIIRKKRHHRGAIDFDFPESKIILNELGKPVEIRAQEANEATRLIEDFMLLANETVAQEFCEKEIPFLYRIHENPDMEKMESVLTYIRAQGQKVDKKKQEISPKEIQTVLSAIEGLPTEPLISRLLLRSMKQARYSTECVGHFGLAAKYYCHFTSPIRRYPDLQIHRIIKDTLRGRMNGAKKVYYEEFLDEVATQSSAMERRAEEVERETVKLKKVEYMEGHLGEEFTGVISGVTAWGIYVELPNTVEGLVHMSNMHDDYYVYDEEKYQLVGERTQKTYGLGDAVTVVADSVDCAMKTIDFRLR